MIVISYGIPKSGSTLAFEMAKAILEIDGSPQRRVDDKLLGQTEHGVNFVREWTDDRLGRLLEATRGSWLVVKTHAPPAYLSTDVVLDAIAGGELRIHVVFRDPRDTVVSMVDHGIRARQNNTRGFSTIRGIEDAIAGLSAHMEYFRRWGSYPSLKLAYEEFAFDPSVGPSRIADDLGVAVDPARVWEMVERRFTQRSVARPERYRTELWPDEITRIEQAFPLFLDLVRGRTHVGWFGDTSK